MHWRVAATLCHAYWHVEAAVGEDTACLVSPSHTIHAPQLSLGVPTLVGRGDVSLVTIVALPRLLSTIMVR